MGPWRWCAVPLEWAVDDADFSFCAIQEPGTAHYKHVKWTRQRSSRAAMSNMMTDSVYLPVVLVHSFVKFMKLL